uniref:LanC-like protein GCL1 n=1 Tax=Nelumbo nucifera TaxID=4432 RepID=A0A822ZBL9_NELNU|nr:TPA_asm: hypothetical protein HUJ06_015374 [Nelumbo nucifera]
MSSSMVEMASQGGDEEGNERLDKLHMTDLATTTLYLTRETFLQAAISLKDRVIEATWKERGGLQLQSMDPTVYTGLLGTAFTCLRSYQATGCQSDLQLCAEIVDTCAAVARSSKRHLTFLCGSGGVYALGAVVANYKDDCQRRDLYLDLFLESGRRDCNLLVLLTLVRLSIDGFHTRTLKILRKM